MSHKLRLAPIAVVLAVAVAGCGGSSSTTGSTSVSAAKALVARADPICKQVSVERSTANATLEKAGHSTAKQLRILARVAPAVAVHEMQAVTRLRALTAPSALNAYWQRMLTGIQQLAEDTSKIAVSAKANQLARVKAVTASGRKIREKLTTLAAHFGFVYCGRTS